MIDKVQKIRNEVERLQNELIQEREKGYCSDTDDACILELQNVLTYIDSLQEEPVSEELEIEVDRWYNNEAPKEFENVLYADIEKCAKHFVNWQKQQDQSTIELAEDHAMLAGMEKMKEEMMVKVVDGTARPDDNEIWCNLASINLKDGDKVKIIVIKED